MPADLDDLRSRIASCSLGAGERASAWRVFLGVSEGFRGQAGSVKASRAAYAKVKAEELPDVASLGGSGGGDPLSGLLGDDGGGAGEKSAWDKYHANVELRAEVEKDLERLNINGIPEAHFTEPERARKMLNVLTVWASGHAQPGYRQGMHEILALFVRALEDELTAGTAPCSGGFDDGAGFDEGDAYALFAACLETHAAMFDTGKGPDAPVLVLCRDAQAASQRLLDLGEAFDAVSPQLYGLRWVRLIFLREFDVPLSLHLWDGLFSVYHAMPRPDRSLPYVLERASVALTCAAAPLLERDDECQQMQVLMRYGDHVKPSVPKILDITTRLVDGRGLPPPGGGAAAPPRAHQHQAAAAPPPLQQPYQAAPAEATRATPFAALRSAAGTAAAHVPSPPAFLKQTALFSHAGAPATRTPPPPRPSPQAAPPSPPPTMSATLDAALAVLRRQNNAAQGDAAAALASVASVAAELRKRGL